MAKKTSTPAKESAEQPATKKQSMRDVLSVRKKQTGTFVTFNKGVRVYFEDKEGNMTELDLGEYRTVKVKSAKEVKESNLFFAEKGYITEEQADERNSKLDEKNITAIVQLPLSAE